MEHPSGGELVTVAREGGARDGIVFHVPSASKVVVAVSDRTRGPILRTVHPSALTERSVAGPHDQALRQLIRRTPAAARGGPRGGNGPGQGPRGGHVRAPAHRATGR
jgi:hypothetical protein